MSSAYLLDHPPVRQQFYKTRNRPLTGCTVLHTAESVMDSVGPDTGAENVAEFIRTRSTPGSYHDLVDSDSVVHLVPYESGAFHDGTGSNNWALSISFACATSDWKRMSSEKRAAFLRNGARAFAAQQKWRRAHGYPLTELRYITKAQSDAGQSGFCCHGWRDPDRRSDPGVAAPNQFPFDEFLEHCRAAMAGTTIPAPQEEEDDMPFIVAIEGAGQWLQDHIGYHWVKEPKTIAALQAAGVKTIHITKAEHEEWVKAQNALSSPSGALTATANVTLDAANLAKELVAAGFGGSSAADVADEIAKRLQGA